MAINMLAFCEFLAVEAVIGEPVSASYFPVLRENTGKFLWFSPPDSETLRLSIVKSVCYGQIPYATDQGIFLSEQEIAF